ncbi:hypothetical protein PCO85_20020 [Prodigiosinella aquatilis]|nr:hypothetical protein [Prodigiosinella sp. LS101]WJV53418.1 hypothetical protein PCO85_20020 [Prodigiosinella sp. LS101]WJV57779.1 hypothetical protein PCO84_20000 [Pectobacteriaceae bacterium C111]
MKIKQTILSATLAAATMCTAGAAFAGPPVQITFKNLGTQEATYKIVTNNEVSTNVNASPKPAKTVAPQGTNTYTVQNPISPDANVAIVRYTMGRKTCVFGTTFVNQIIGGGLLPGGPTKVPKWNKTATASGGAVCNATIRSQNLSNYSWTVEFTMK